MASFISAAELPTSSGRLFYCHQCSHQWRKTENSEYLCPQCREGFIEEVSDTNNVPGENTSEPIFSIIHRIISDPSSRRSRAQGTSSRAAGTNRSRSRSPRMSFYIGSTSADRDARGRNDPRLESRRLERGFSSRAFHFDLDDLMSTFLSTRSPPVSQSVLQELPLFTITQDQTDTPCSICFDDFKLAEASVRKLPCNHLFHEPCIFPWLRINGTCPVCRARLTPADSGNDDPGDNMTVANFDNILRFMRVRRNTRNRENEASTSSSSAQTDSSEPRAQPLAAAVNTSPMVRLERLDIPDVGPFRRRNLFSDANAAPASSTGVEPPPRRLRLSNMIARRHVPSSGQIRSGFQRALAEARRTTRDGTATEEEGAFQVDNRSARLEAFNAARQARSQALIARMAERGEARRAEVEARMAARSVARGEARRVVAEARREEAEAQREVAEAQREQAEAQREQAQARREQARNRMETLHARRETLRPRRAAQLATRELVNRVLAEVQQRVVSNLAVAPAVTSEGRRQSPDLSSVIDLTSESDLDELSPDGSDLTSINTNSSSSSSSSSMSLNDMDTDSDSDHLRINFGRRRRIEDDSDSDTIIIDPTVHFSDEE